MSESDSDTDHTAYSSKLRSAIKKCKDAVPTYTASAASISRPAIDKKKSILTEDRKKLEDTLAKLSFEVSEFQTKLGEILNCVQILYDGFQNLEQRMDEIEQKVASANASYAAAAARPQNSEPSMAAQGRVEKLEYMVSEEERKKRILQISITHTSIDNNVADLSAHIKTFLSTSMKMSAREIDDQMTVQKLSRANSVLLTVTDARFKKFLYNARKQLRTAEDELSNELYLNDYLTSHNFNILKLVKNKRQERDSQNRRTFKTVYTFEGKVFVKMNRDDANSTAVHIKNLADISSLCTKLDQSPNTDN